MMQPGRPFGYMHPPPGYGLGYGAMPARAEGMILDYPVHGAHLPAVCCKCGTPHGLSARVATMVWINPIAWLGALGGLLPLALLIAFMQKRVSVVLPICTPCNRRWSNAVVLRVLSFFAPFVLGPLVGALIGLFAKGDTAFFVGIFASFFLLLAIPIAVTKLVYERRVLVAAKIDDQRAKLKGASPELLRALGG